MKKIISVIVLLAMVLAMVGTASAATDNVPADTDFSALVTVVVDALYEIKYSLKNPESLQVNGIAYTPSLNDHNNTFYIWLDFSAQNSLGGYTRTNLLYCKNVTTGERNTFDLGYLDEMLPTDKLKLQQAYADFGAEEEAALNKQNIDLLITLMEMEPAKKAK